VVFLIFVGLSAAQVTAARKIYRGPRNPETGELIFPGYEPGSEANIALCDLAAKWTVGEEGYESRSQNSWCAGRELTGFDLGDPDTRFNLELATRAWVTLQALRG